MLDKIKDRIDDMLRALLGISIAIIMLSGSLLLVASHRASDSYLRDRVVMLYNPMMGSCSGVMVKAPSGHTYVLSAGHCALLITNNTVLAKDESGRAMVLTLVEEDMKADLLLFEGDFLASGIPVADSVSHHQHVRTITHGAGAASYRTDGEVVDDLNIVVPTSIIQSAEDLKLCLSKSKNTVESDFFGEMICALNEKVMRSTAIVIAGSSGGPLFDDDGRLAGIVSATDGHFGLFATLDDIHRFLQDK